ncbi:MAG: hypothetical protein U0835_20185 [Isosphaeraceae bacterium]
MFSFAQGIFHEYYSTVMGPAVAALAGVGAVTLWGLGRRHGALAGVLLLTAAWQAVIVWLTPNVRAWLLPAFLVPTLLGVVVLVLSGWLAGRFGSLPWARLAGGLTLAGLLAAPTTWSLSAVIYPGMSMIPSADPLMVGRGPGGRMPMGPPSELNPRHSEARRIPAREPARREILVAGPQSMSVSPVIIETGETAVSLGGFMGADPVVDKDGFARMVNEGHVRFVLIGGPGGPPGGPGGPMGRRPGGPGGGGPGRGMRFGPPGRPGGPGGPGNSEVMAWVREHGKLVDPKLWRLDEPRGEADEEGGPPMPGPMGRAAQLFDCRPEKGIVGIVESKS